MTRNKQLSTRKINTKQMALVGLMTAVICLLAPFSIVLPFSPIPISLGTFAIYLTVTVLGRKHGFLSVLLYLLLGFAGLPVFTGFTGGAGRLLGPTGGYMIGYLFIAFIYGSFVDRWSHRLFVCFLGMLLATAICYAFGTIWLAMQSELDFLSALAASILPFIPGDLVKMGITMTIGYQIRMRLKKAALI